MQFGPKLSAVDNLVLALDAGNLISYSGSGTTWTDLSGNRNNGTLTNGPTFSSINCGSIVFDGSNDYVDVPDFDLGTQFTFVAWIKTTSTSLGQIIARGNSADNRGLGFYINNTGAVGKLGASGNNGSGWNSATISNTIINDGVWHQVVGVYNQTSNRCIGYVDGVLGLSGTITFDSNSYTPKNAKIGRNHVAALQYYSGNIAYFQIYNRELTATEILQNYNATKSRFESTLTRDLLVSLDASNPSSYPGSGTTWTDLSKNGNNGTLTNGPTFSSANGGSIVFDGTNDYVTGNITNVSVYTFSIFIKITSYRVGGGLICGTGGSLGAQLGGSNTLQFENVTTAFIPTTGQWYHFAFVQSTGSNQLMYINGSLYATNTGTSSLGSGYSLARREVSGPIYLNCEIGVAQIYSRDLSANEITEIYNNSKSRFGL